MTRAIRVVLVIGAALMAVGCALPWGRLWTLSSGEVTTAGGFGHGAEVVLPLAVLIAVAAVAGWRWVAVVLAGVALAVVVASGVALPGDLHDASVAQESGIYALFGEGSWRAATADGWSLAFCGALVAFGGAVWTVVRRARREAPPRATIVADRP